MPSNPREVAVYLFGIVTTIVVGIAAKYLLHPQIDKYIQYRSTRKNKHMEEEYLLAKDLYENNQKISSRILQEVSTLSTTFGAFLAVSSIAGVLQTAKQNVDPIISAMQYGAYFYLSGYLLHKTADNAKLHWRINNFSKYQNSVRKKLGYVPNLNAEAAPPG